MFPPTPASESLSEFAGALGGSFTGRPQKPMVRAVDEPLMKLYGEF